MLGLLNNAKSYARTKDNSLPTYIEVRFEKRNVFNHGSPYVESQSEWTSPEVHLFHGMFSSTLERMWGLLSACENKSRNFEKIKETELQKPVKKYFSSPAKLLRKTEKAYSGSVVVRW